MRKVKFYLMFLLFLLLHCTASQVRLNDFPPINYADTDMRALVNDYPEARAVFLLNEIDLEYFQNRDQAFTIVKRHIVVAILNKRGYEYANIILPFDSETRISKIKARTILSNGQSVFLNKNAIYDANLFPEYIFYSDVNAKRFTMPGVAPGCIIEYEWEQKRSGFNLVSQWEFQKEDPVLCSRYLITTDAQIPIKAKLYGVQETDIRKEKVIRGRKQIQWELRNISALNPEISMANGYQEIPSIVFSSAKFDTWEDVNDWYYNLFTHQIKLNHDLKDLVTKLTSPSDSELERLAKIFSFVQQNIRYLAIEVGLGGYQPYRSDKVLSNRYGDCKDMALLIAALAKAANLSVSPVLLSNYMHGPADTSLVSHHHFNHVIAYAKLSDGTEVWMDPTDKTVAFGFLPWYDQHRFVLVVDSDRGQMIKTPALNASYNLSVRHWKMEIGSNGIAEGRVQIELSGALASEMRTELQMVNPVNIESWLSRNMIEAFPFTRINKISLKGIDETESPFIMQIDFKTDAIDIQNENYIAVQPGLFSGFNLHKVFYENERTYDVALKYPIMIVDSMDISYPDSWIAISGISSDSLESDYGTYCYKMDVNQVGSAFYRRAFALDQVHISVNEYMAFRNFLYQSFQMDRSLVLYQEY